MARVAINAIAKNPDGYDLTNSADFTTLATGDDNGVELSGAGVVFLKHSAAAVFTIKSFQSPQYAGQNIVVPDKTVSVGANTTFVYYPSTATLQGGKLLIDCDVAGEVLGIQ